MRLHRAGPAGHSFLEVAQYVRIGVGRACLCSFADASGGPARRPRSGSGSTSLLFWLLRTSRRGGPRLMASLLKPSDVARQLGVSRAWVYDAAKRGRIPSIRIGGEKGPLRFVPEDLELGSTTLVPRGGQAARRSSRVVLRPSARSGRDRKSQAAPGGLEGAAEFLLRALGCPGDGFLGRHGASSQDVALEMAVVALGRAMSAWPSWRCTYISELPAASHAAAAVWRSACSGMSRRLASWSAALCQSRGRCAVHRLGRRRRCAQRPLIALARPAPASRTA